MTLPVPPTTRATMSTEQAVILLRADPKYASFLREAYLDGDVGDCAERYGRSGELHEIRRLLGTRGAGTILDLGAGTGIASYAFGTSGAKAVWALEPDPSDVVGAGAIRRVSHGLNIGCLAGYGEAIPLPDASVDVVFARQVLHHTRDLTAVLRECSRVLGTGGLLLACREHVADDAAQLRAFQDAHVLHRLLGGESAYPLSRYLEAIGQAGLKTRQVLGPWDSVINAYPGVESQAELAEYPRRLLALRLGRAGGLLANVPTMRTLVWRWLKRPVPGRLYSFLAEKP